MSARERITTRIIAALVVVPVLLCAVSFAHDFMRCRVTGFPVAICACPDERAPAQAKLVEQPCCEWQTIGAMDAVESSGAGSSRERDHQILDCNGLGNLPLASSIVVAIGPRTAPPPTRWRVTDSRAQRPALIVSKQSFLI